MRAGETSSVRPDSPPRISRLTEQTRPKRPGGGKKICPEPEKSGTTRGRPRSCAYPGPRRNKIRPGGGAYFRRAGLAKPRPAVSANKNNHPHAYQKLLPPGARAD